MRTALWWIFALALAGSATAQEAHGDAREAPPGGFAVGVLATPALEGGGPWFMPAIRLTAPLGARHGFDLDVGRIVGGNGPYAEIEHFAAGQLRFARKQASATSTRYWLLGLRYTDIWKLDDYGNRRRHDPDTALSVGYGGTHNPHPGVRIVSEFGFSGGRGYLLYATMGVQWEPWASR